MMKRTLVVLMTLATSTTMAATKVQLEERVANHINTINKLERRGALEQMSKSELQSALSGLKVVIKSMRGQSSTPVEPTPTPSPNKKVSAKQLTLKMASVFGEDQKVSKAFRKLTEEFEFPKFKKINSMCSTTSTWALEKKCFTTEIKEINKPLNVTVKTAKSVAGSVCPTTPSWESEVQCFTKVARVIGKPALSEKVSDCKDYNSTAQTVAKCIRQKF